MKNFTILIVTFFCLSLNSQGQTILTNDTNKLLLTDEFDQRLKPQFGFRIGTNCSNVFDPEGAAFKTTSLIRLVAGVFFVYPINAGVGLQPEILFSQKGFKVSGKILDAPYNLTRTTNYLDVPILFAFKLTPNFTILIGPQYSYLINQQDVFDLNTTNVAQENEFAKNNIRKNMFGFSFGIDAHVNHLLLGLRAQWDVLTNTEAETSTAPIYKNALLRATIGYRFYNN